MRKNDAIHTAAQTLGKRGGLAKNKIQDQTDEQLIIEHAKILGNLGGLKGGPARSLSLSKRRKKQIATYGSYCAKLKKGKSLTDKEQETFETLKILFSNRK